ncbi:MAG TPA: ABC transporter substrate-binding protein [Devosia sp.]|nr:ABC transporter substrate-binding protein [Devosia sp.]
MSREKLPLGGMNRRAVLKGGAGLVAGVGIASLLSNPAFAQEQVLRIANGGFDMDWSPLRGGGRVLRWQSFWWATPMYFDSEGALHPYVVTSWEPNADMTVWTFKVDPAATFSDGSKITASDLKGSWEVAAMPSSRHVRINQVLAGVVGYDEVTGGTAKDMPGIVAQDDETLVVTLKAADPIFFMRIANELVPVLKPSEARDENGEEVLEWFAPDMGGVTSGPFKLVEMNLDDGFLAFEPNENFFGKAPKLTRVEIRSVEDPVTATTLLRQGEFQAHTELVTSTVIDDLGTEFSSGPSIPTGQHFWFNVNSEPFNDANVRQAFIMAVDRNGMMQASFPNGPHKQAEQLLVAVPGVDPDFEPYPYDPAKAKELLAASSYGGAESLPRLVMVGIGSPAQKAAAQFIVEQWRQNLGVSAVELLERQDNFAPADVHIFRDDIGTRVPDAVAFLAGGIKTGGGIASGKMNGYSNPEIDKLLDEAALLPVDDPQRDEKARAAQKLFRDDWGYLPWYYETMSRWALPSVTNMDKNLDWQVVNPWDVTIV